MFNDADFHSSFCSIRSHCQIDAIQFQIVEFLLIAKPSALRLKFSQGSQSLADVADGKFKCFTQINSSHFYFHRALLSKIINDNSLVNEVNAETSVWWIILSSV